MCKCYLLATSFIFEALQFQEHSTMLLGYLVLLLYVCCSDSNRPAEPGLIPIPLLCPQINTGLTYPVLLEAFGLDLPPGSHLWSERWYRCRRRHSLPLL